MKKTILCILLCLTLLLPTTCFAVGDGLSAAEQILQNASATTFVVLHTGDVNGKETVEDGAIGYAKLAGFAAETRKAQETLLLDSGNALSGDGGKSIQVMSAAGYDAAAIGTRDAALGIERLQELSGRADFPLLCANWLRDDGEVLFDPYAIVDVGSVRVGIIGLISPEIAQLYPDVTAGCNVYKPSGIANIYYEEMVEQGCTYFIALTSLGYDGEYTPKDLGTESPWLNLILDSNTKTLLDMGELIDQTNVIAFNLPTDFAALGQYTVTTGTASGQNTTLPEVLSAEDLKGIADDKNVKQAVEADDEEPSVGDESTGEGTEPSASSASFHLSSRAIFLISFVVVMVAIVVIILVMSRSKPADKKKK